MPIRNTKNPQLRTDPDPFFIERSTSIEFRIKNILIASNLKPRLTIKIIFSKKNLIKKNFILQALPVLQSAQHLYEKR